MHSGDPAKPLHRESSDPAPPLASVLSSNNGRANSYPEMLSQLGHHLEDLGSILVVHGLRHGGALDLAATPPTVTCCSIPRPSSSTGGKHPQAAALEAARHDLQWRLTNMNTQRQPDKLWELIGGMKSSPPPVSPWIFDPACSGRMQTSKEATQNGTATIQPLETAHAVTASAQGYQQKNADVGTHQVESIRVEEPEGTDKMWSCNGNTAGIPESPLNNTLGGKNVVITAERVSVCSDGSMGSEIDHYGSTFSYVKDADCMPRRTEKKDMLIGKAKHKQNEEVKKARLVSIAQGEVLEDCESDMSEENPVFQIQDSLVAIVILLNALVMGASADIQWPGGWEIIEYLFTAFFTSEMLYKMRNLGLDCYFRGPDANWNIFDFVVVTIAIIDLAIAVIIKTMNAGDSVDLSKFTVVKLARLGRLARLIRLLRFKMFKELKMMITGVFAGLRVLFWAIILFFGFIFLLAMIIRNIYMEEDWIYLNQSFGSVPWSMFTLFTCFTDGCTAHDGVPLIALFYKRYGAYFMITYTLIFLFVSVGLFNLIMAIFVDNVMESTRQRKTGQRELNYDKQEQRLRGTVLEVIKKAIKALNKLKKEKTNVGSKQFRATMLEQAQARNSRLNMVLLKHPVFGVVLKAVEFIFKKCICCKLCRRKHGAKDDNEEDEDLELPEDLVIERRLFNLIIEDPDMDEMLDLLDISTSNRWELFDVLDADLSGNLDLEELVVGLMSMRGPPEKSDIVANLLCARRGLIVLQDVKKDMHAMSGQMTTNLTVVQNMAQIVQRLCEGTSQKETLAQALVPAAGSSS